jgi:hypothetical protein
MLKDKRISVMIDVKITKLQGITKLDSIFFEKKVSKRDEKDVEYFLNPDIVIAENGVGSPKYNLQSLLTAGKISENGEPPI